MYLCKIIFSVSFLLKQIYIFEISNAKLNKPTILQERFRRKALPVKISPYALIYISIYIHSRLACFKCFYDVITCLIDRLKIRCIVLHLHQ